MQTPGQTPDNNISKRRPFLNARDTFELHQKLGGVSPDVGRGAIEKVDFPDQPTRDRLMVYLDGVKSFHIPERAEIISQVIAQYDSSVSTWRQLNVDTKGIQTREEVAGWLDSLSTEALQGLAAYGEVRLKFIPPAKASELIHVINENQLVEYQIPRSNISDRGQWQDIGSSEWQFGLTSDIQDMPFDPSIIYRYWDPANPHGSSTQGRLDNGEMVSRYERQFRGQKLELMPQEAYLPGAMDAMVQGKMWDRKYSTAFKGREGSRIMPAAELHDIGGIRISLTGKASLVTDENLRCRPWLQGKKV